MFSKDINFCYVSVFFFIAVPRIEEATIEHNELDQQLDKLKDFLLSDLADEHLSQTSESKRQWLLRQLEGFKSQSNCQQDKTDVPDNINHTSQYNPLVKDALQGDVVIRCGSAGQSDYETNCKQVSFNMHIK
ncbi:hypothetical protein TrispH2_004637 [Trichoplax sp. H2]|nr:hypothetical protein TrispH2_004637 [Trichoplax sp. H2]|eukprot:RDD44237.1 hypothetical protein TrispH2_004637 [Trichoplax sp. H2]